MFSTTSFASSLDSVSTTNNTKPGTSDIPKSVLRQARISAEETVFNVGTEKQVYQLLHSQGLKDVLKQDNLTPKEFREEIKTGMTTYLTDKGYSQTQITAALDSRYMRHHRYHI